MPRRDFRYFVTKCWGSLSFDIIVNEMGYWTVRAYLLSWTLLLGGGPKWSVFHRWTSFDWNIQLKLLLLLRVLDAKCRSMKIIHASTILATCKGWSLYKISLATAPLKNLQCQPSHATFGPCTSCPLFLRVLKLSYLGCNLPVWRGVFWYCWDAQKVGEFWQMG
jgi:hypothetical protein